MQKYLLVFLVFLALFCMGAETYPLWPRSAISNAAQCLAITSSSQQYTLPSTVGSYYIKVKDNNVYLLEGTNPTVTVTIGTGHGIPLGDGDIWGPVRLHGPKVAYISDTAGGEICFIPLQ